MKLRSALVAIGMLASSVVAVGAADARPGYHRHHPHHPHHPMPHRHMHRR